MAGRRTRKRTLPPDHYFVRSQLPLASLVFLSPMLVFYEVGAIYLFESGDVRLAAQKYLSEVLNWFGAVGPLLPALAVVGVLTAWHIARRDPWRLEMGVYVKMGAESLGLALPLLILALLAGPRGGAAALAGGSWGELAGAAASANPLLEMGLAKGLVLSVGAGVYEELVFRLALIALVHMLLVDVLKVAELRGATIAILASAVLFAMAHFQNLSDIRLASLAFYFAAGIYFAVIYIVRGFGIVAATHALYDVLLVTLAWGMRE